MFTFQLQLHAQSDSKWMKEKTKAKALCSSYWAYQYLAAERGYETRKEHKFSY